MATQFDAIDLLTRYETPLLKDMDKDDDVLEWVAAFVGSDSFQDAVNGFCEQHADVFKILLTKGGPCAEDLDAIEGCVSLPHDFICVETNVPHVHSPHAARGRISTSSLSTRPTALLKNS
jgi:hypothetical protein